MARRPGGGGARSARRGPKQPPRAGKILKNDFQKLLLNSRLNLEVDRVGWDRRRAVIDEDITHTLSDLFVYSDTLVPVIAISMQVDTIAKSRTKQRHRARIGIVSQKRSCSETSVKHQCNAT